MADHSNKIALIRIGNQADRFHPRQDRFSVHLKELPMFRPRTSTTLQQKAPCTLRCSRGQQCTKLLLEPHGESMPTSLAKIHGQEISR